MNTRMDGPPAPLATVIMPVPEQQSSEDMRAWFAAIAQVQGWSCCLCDQAIQFEDLDSYVTAGRCSQCEDPFDVRR